MKSAEARTRVSRGGSKDGMEEDKGRRDLRHRAAKCWGHTGDRGQDVRGSKGRYKGQMPVPVLPPLPPTPHHLPTASSATCSTLTFPTVYPTTVIHNTTSPCPLYCLSPIVPRLPIPYHLPVLIPHCSNGGDKFKMTLQN